MRKRRLTSGIALALSLSLSAPGLADDMTLDFRLLAQHIVLVQGSIGRFNKLNLILDTGVSPSIIDKRLADKLKLQVRRVRFGDRVLDQSQPVVGLLVILPYIEIGPIKTRDFEVRVVDLSSWRRALGRQIHGIVGSDFLRLSCFEIDYRSGTVRFGLSPKVDSAVRMDTTSLVPIVPIRIQGQEIRLLLDTAANHLLLFKDRVASLEHLKERGRTSVFTALGKVSYRRFTLKGVSIGSTEFKRITALVSEAAVDESLPFDGILGTAALDLDSIHLDWELETFSIRRRRHPKADPRHLLPLKDNRIQQPTGKLIPEE